LELDFSEEDVEFADRTELRNLIISIQRIIERLIDSFEVGNVIKNGIPVAIVGKPNAGKSTLLNALLKENRAIVSAIAGTTRDTIEEVLNIDGILFRLIDTAGIREGADEIEAIGVEKSREKMKSADIVLYLFDAVADSTTEVDAMQKELQLVSRSWMMIGNKVDSLDAVAERDAVYGLKDAVYISAKQDLGLELLKTALTEKVISGGVNTENTIVTNARHYQSLQKLSETLMAIRTGMQNEIPGDLLSIDIRQCLYHLGEITGQISNEDQLDFIFSKFCIGK
jgi:tRNA modification GTPase